MVKGLKCGVAVAGMIASVAVAASPAQAQMACGKPMTQAQKLQRLMDIADITNVASSHEYLHGALMHQEEIEQSWSKRDDVTWTNGTDKYANRKSFWAFYVTNLKNFPHKSALWYHMLTTPYIVVSGDGQTAKGIFMSFGNVSGKVGPGDAMAQWTEEKYGIDFIKEDGQWKIWHLRTYVEFYTKVGDQWTDSRNNLAAVDTLKLQGRNPDGSLKAGVQQEAGSTFYGVKPDEQKVFYPGYTVDRDPQYNPVIPQPYCTFKDVEAY